MKMETDFIRPEKEMTYDDFVEQHQTNVNKELPSSVPFAITNRFANRINFLEYNIDCFRTYGWSC